MKRLLEEIAVASCTYAQKHDVAIIASTELSLAPAAAHLYTDRSIAAIKQLPALLPAQIDMFLCKIHMSPAFAEAQVSFTSLLTGMPKTCQELLLPSNG